MAKHDIPPQEPVYKSMDDFWEQWDKQLPSNWVRVNTETHGVIVFNLITYDSENHKYIGNLDLERTEHLNQQFPEHKAPIVAMINQTQASAGNEVTISIHVYEDATYKFQVDLNHQ